MPLSSLQSVTILSPAKIIFAHVLGIVMWSSVFGAVTGGKSLVIKIENFEVLKWKKKKGEENKKNTLNL